ncbi:MAG TPA: BREX-3 system P-loop-containing protein BrxF [Oculatellaceae cyanobacterium]|jgi:ATP-dependent helicase/nuclease subunit A
MNLTSEQQAAAYANNSVAVTAGAGTGKTHMLAERYIHHLRVDDLSPLEIVSVTFTEKAAAELRSRIRSSVTNQLPERSDLLAELEAAQISTIHALATRICREHPQAANVPPDFTILDELEGALWLDERLEEALDTLPASLYELIPYSLMSAALTILIKDPIVAEISLSQGIGFWSELASKLRQLALFELLTHPDWILACQVLYDYSGQPSDLREQARQQVLDAIAKLQAGEDSISALELLLEIKLRGGSAKKWLNGGFDEVKEAITTLRDNFTKPALKKGLISLTVGESDTQLAAMLPILKEAFGLVQDYLTSAKRHARALDFADLEVSALRALESPEIRSYYAQRWKAFLVDEFQDTNPVQGKILQSLTQGAVVTIVGDVKQSIYGFRRADVLVFQAWRDRILAEGGNEVILSTSFRTHQLLVQDINQIFTLVLGELHQDLQADRTQSPHSLPSIRVRVVEGDSGANKILRQRVEAKHIAELLQEMLNTQTLVHDKKTDSLRPIVPGDIAILSRTWDSLQFYGEALESMGIPVALAGGGSLMETREAKDAWTLLRFLADPHDDLALVAVLRSPFFAINDRILFTIVQNQEAGVKSPIEWWSRLKTANISQLSRPIEVLTQLLRDRHIEPPTRLLQLADRLTGYTAVIANLPGAERRQADWRGFLELVRKLEHGNSDVFDVVRRLKRLTASDVEIPRLPLQAENAVALMTIHAAKGLEWSVVVVPDLTRSQPANTDVVYFDPTYGVAMKLADENGEAQKPVLFVYLEYLRKQREEAEARRVLYVALTRARDQLILTATDPSKVGGLDQLLPGLELAGIPIETIPFDSESAQPPILPTPVLPPEPPRLLLDAVGSGLFELPVTALSEYARCPKRFQFRFIDGHPGIGTGVATAQRIGTLVHKALERDIRDADTLAAFDLSVGRELIDEAIALAQRFDLSPFFAPFQEIQAQREQPVTLNIGRLRLNGVVDLLGADWVLDFKTDQEMIPDHHRFQLWAYAQATGRATAHIAYLRHDQLHTFSVAELAATEVEAQTLVQSISDGHYPAAPSSLNCACCSYAELCQECYQDDQAETSVQDAEGMQELIQGENTLLSTLQTSEFIDGDFVPPSVSQPLLSPRVELLCSEIASHIEQAQQMYYRLIVVVNDDATEVIDFRQVSKASDGRCININLELSQRLLELTQRQRSLKVARLLLNILGNAEDNILFLDHLEILFDPSLQLKPLKCLQDLARNRTIVALWNGRWENNHLIYAEPGHPEYCRYPKGDFLVVIPGQAENK